jgi:AbrB family transcriptional regulator (stage V sporulation protein T)
MKATGIVRRIDDLGRVVIPKEIRRTMRIREGDPLEIYTDREGAVIFKKYSLIGELQGFSSEYADTLHKTSGLPIFICDRDEIIAVAGASKREYLDKKISVELEEIIDSRALYQNNSLVNEKFIVDTCKEHRISCAMPIITEGDVVGCVLTGENETAQADRISKEIEAKLIQTAGIFLGKQMEG